MKKRLGETLDFHNFFSIDYKEYASIDCVSAKQKKAKKSLMELASAEDQRMTPKEKTRINRKSRILEPNPWTNMMIEESTMMRRTKLDNYMVNGANLGRNCQSKQRNEKQNSIQHLKSLLSRLESPTRKQQTSSKMRHLYPAQNRTQKELRSHLTSARTSQHKRQPTKAMWSIRQSQLKLLFEPLSNFKSKPQTSKTKHRSNSTKICSIQVQNRSSQIKKDALKAKVINFYTRIPETAVGIKKRFSLFELIE